MAIEDVRKVIKSYEGTHIPTEFHRRETLAREAFNKRLAEEKAKTPRSAVGGLASMLGMKAQPQMVGPSLSEGFAQGKMLSDLMREQGLQQYQALDKEIRENGEKWLKEMADEEKKAQDEQLKGMQGGVLSFFGGGPPPAATPPPSQEQ
jgi:import inner membrane translocase subunit TIM50